MRPPQEIVESESIHETLKLAWIAAEMSSCWSYSLANICVLVREALDAFVQGAKDNLRLEHPLQSFRANRIEPTSHAERRSLLGSRRHARDSLTCLGGNL